MGSSAQHIFDGSEFLKSPVNPFCEKFKSITIKNRILVNDDLKHAAISMFTHSSLCLYKSIGGKDAPCITGLFTL